MTRPPPKSPHPPSPRRLGAAGAAAGQRRSEQTQRGMEPRYGDDVDIRDLTLDEIKSLDKATAERLVKRAGRWARWYVYTLLTWAMLVAVMALATPADVFDRWSWAKAFVMQMTEWFPFLGSHARYSRFPQAVSFVKAASFSLLPLGTATGLAFCWRYRRVALASLIAGIRKTFVKPTTELLFVFVYALCILGVWVLPGDPGFMKGFTTGSRLGLALIDGTGFFFAAFIPGMFVLSVFVRVNAHHIPRDLNWRT